MRHRRSGVIGWPGSNVPVNGYLSYKMQKYNSTRPFLSTVKQVLDWFHEPISTRINFGAVYNREPDQTGKIIVKSHN